MPIWPRRRGTHQDAEQDRRAEVAVIAERARIAREVHDIVAHNLSVMIALADGAALTMDRDPDRARDAIAQVADTGRTALTEMRQSLSLLRSEQDVPRTEPEPRLANVEALLETVRATGLQVTYVTSGPTDSLPDSVQLTVFRLVQEALTNAMKHASRLTRMQVSVRRGDADVRVVVDDNGAGAPVDPPLGFGLIGMRERVALLGGRLLTGPTQNGWRVSAWIPLDAGRRR